MESWKLRVGVECTDGDKRCGLSGYVDQGILKSQDPWHPISECMVETEQSELGGEIKGLFSFPYVGNG